jgi:hypothetical protein
LLRGVTEPKPNVRLSENDSKKMKIGKMKKKFSHKTQQEKRVKKDAP